MGSLPVGPNVHAIGTDLRAWLLREGELSYFLASEKTHKMAYTNPYTYDTSTLALVLASVVNSASALSKDASAVDAVETEIARFRIYSELVLYMTRSCEGTIKQLLYCTGIPRSYYERASLGSLLRTECISCRRDGGMRHHISLLGSLAHRYGLCIPIEECLAEHMKLVGRRRNLEVAHSGVGSFTPADVNATRLQMSKEVSDLGGECIHMMTHIRDLEEHMISELGSGG